MRRMENELRRVAYFSMEVGLDSAVPTYSGGLGVLTLDLVGRVLQEPEPFSRFKDIMAPGRTLNLTFLALNLSGYVDGVAKKHGETSRLMFAGYRIEAITNGVHAATWTCESFQRLYDRHLPDWRQDNFSLRGALNLPTREVWEAHLVAKNKLLDEVRARTGDSMEIEPLTIGFTRRATAYKRADLLFTDLDRLKAVSRKAGGLQLIFTGKAHPRDQGGKEVIHRIVQARQSLQGEVEIT